MNQRKWLRLILVFVLTSLLLDACSFSVQVMSTPVSSPPTVTSIASSSTSIPPTTDLASPTPTLINISIDMVGWLEIFKNFGQGEILRSVAFTPDNAVVASVAGNTEDFAIHLWDVMSGEAIGTLSGHTGIVWDIAFSPDGQLLASVSSDQTVKIWDWDNGELLKSLELPGEVIRLSFSPAGEILAVGGVDESQNQLRNAAVWTFSVDTWEPLIKFPEYWNIGAMVYSPDGSMLVGGGTSRNVQVWRTSDGVSPFTLNHAHQVGDAAVSPDGSTVATATCETAANIECTEGSV